MNERPAIEIVIDGHKPRPKGSKRAVVNRRTGRVVVMEQVKGIRAWMRVIRAALPVPAPQWREHAPVAIDATFYFSRPKSHYTARGKLSATGRRQPYPPGRYYGDVDKLLRAVLDALTGPVLADDSQVVEVTGRKEWADQDGCRIVARDIAAGKECATPSHSTSKRGSSKA